MCISQPPTAHWQHRLGFWMRAFYIVSRSCGTMHPLPHDDLKSSNGTDAESCILGLRLSRFSLPTRKTQRQTCMKSTLINLHDCQMRTPSPAKNSEPWTQQMGLWHGSTDKAICRQTGLVLTLSHLRDCRLGRVCPMLGTTTCKTRTCSFMTSGAMGG